MSDHAESLLRELYSRFGKGDLPGVLELCTDDIVFHVPGTAPFSGDYTRSNFGDLIGQVMQISGGTFREEIVDLVANDQHGVAILDHFLERGGKKIAYRTDHIWQLRDGKCCGWLERPGDEDAFSRVWS